MTLYSPLMLRPSARLRICHSIGQVTTQHCGQVHEAFDSFRRPPTHITEVGTAQKDGAPVHNFDDAVATGNSRVLQSILSWTSRSVVLSQRLSSVDSRQLYGEQSLHIEKTKYRGVHVASHFAIKCLDRRGAQIDFARLKPGAFAEANSWPRSFLRL